MYSPNGNFVATCRFEKNPLYWDANAVRTPKLKLLMIDNYNTAVNMYKTGEFDYSTGNDQLPAEFTEYLREFNDYRNEAFLSVYWYYFNISAPPLDNIKVRKALSLAVDREALTTHILRAGQIPSADFVPDGLAGYQGLKSPIFDPEQARTLLRQAGYPNGKGLPEITLIYNTSEGHRQIAESIQQMWNKNLGIHVNIENQEWKVFLTRLARHDFQIARMGWHGD